MASSRPNKKAQRAPLPPHVTARTINSPEFKEPGRYRVKRTADDSCKGLFLQVTQRGSRSFVLRYRSPTHRNEQNHAHGRERWLGLGAVGEISLAGAIALAAAARKQIKDGIDPVAERQQRRLDRTLQAARASLTFEQATRLYLDQHEHTWKNDKHRQQWGNSLRDHAFPVLGALDVARIDTPLVLQVLEPIWPTKNETASRVRGRIEKVLGWSMMKGHRPEGDNPAAWDRIQHALPKQGARVNHHAALPYAAMPAFMAELAQREGIAPRALAFTILTAARTSQTTEATWNEVDLEARLWTIPAERMKLPREHRVPLSDEALAILQAMPRDDAGDYVFPGLRSGTPLSNMAMAETLKRMNVEVTVHGFRSTFKDWASETTPHDGEVTEMALAHTIKNKAEAAYRRGHLLEKRARLMQEWADYATGRPASKNGRVVPIRRIGA